MNHILKHRRKHFADDTPPGGVGSVLLLHCDGADESTTITDATGRHSPVANGTAQIDTAQSVFGGASLLLDGNSDYVDVIDSPDWQFGSGEFTIELMARFNSFADQNPFVSQFQASPYDVSFNLVYADGASALGVFTDTGAGGTKQHSWSWSPVVDTWYHVALVRDGDFLRAFIDGSEIGSASSISGALEDGGQPLDIGIMRSSSTYYLNGWIDELRVLKGVAANTDTTFPVPTGPYT